MHILRTDLNIRAVARELVAISLRLTGLPTIVRRIGTRGRVAIVIYHDPKPEALDRHLAYMSKRFTFITLTQFVDALHARDLSTLPSRSMVVTIDDGHRGNRMLGDVFRKHGCRPTLYICTGIVGTHRRFWFQTGNVAHLKVLPQRERMRVLRDRAGFEPTREYPDTEPQALSPEDLDAMRDWSDFESHTRFHPILTTCDDAECEDEIFASRPEVERFSGRTCGHFSYPNGDYTDREIQMVKRAGYRSARTTDFGWNGVNTDPYRLRISGVSDDASENILALQLSCIPSYFRCLLSGSLTGATPKNVLPAHNDR